METKNYFWQSLLIKVGLIAVLALLMLIPLSMIRKQTEERKDRNSETIQDITRNWGSDQTFSGPWLNYKYERVVDKEGKKETLTGSIKPQNLTYEIKATSKELHRSIFDVNVYTADVEISGEYRIDSRLASLDRGHIQLKISDLKGIQGIPSVTLDGKPLKVTSTEGALDATATIGSSQKEGDILPFKINLTINGSQNLSVKPLGNLTTVTMESDYPSPSFTGDFLPAERDVREDGFSAKWVVSEFTLSSPSSNYFGVNLIKPVTQYLQTERATKYGLLVIFLVFLAGIVVEIVSKRPINIIQYLVIGASLVLFYSLLLAFSEFIAFCLSYLIAAAMTTAALTVYFVGIVKSRWAYLLGGLVGLTYAVIYVLLQLETFAFLTGTLLLFAILCVIMLLTRNLQVGDPKLAPRDNGEAQDPK